MLAVTTGARFTQASDFAEGTYYPEETNISVSEVEFFGEPPERGDAVYVTGDNAGFAFNFTGGCLAS